MLPRLDRRSRFSWASQRLSRSSWWWDWSLCCGGSVSHPSERRGAAHAIIRPADGIGNGLLGQVPNEDDAVGRLRDVRYADKLLRLQRFEERLSFLDCTFPGSGSNGFAGCFHPDHSVPARSKKPSQRPRRTAYSIFGSVSRGERVFTEPKISFDRMDFAAT